MSRRKGIAITSLIGPAADARIKSAHDGSGIRNHEAGSGFRRTDEKRRLGGPAESLCEAVQALLQVRFGGGEGDADAAVVAERRSRHDGEAVDIE